MATTDVHVISGASRLVRGPSIRDGLKSAPTQWHRFRVENVNTHLEDTAYTQNVIQVTQKDSKYLIESELLCSGEILYVLEYPKRLAEISNTHLFALRNFEIYIISSSNHSAAREGGVLSRQIA